MKLFVDLLSNPPLFLIALQQGRFFMETRLDPEIQDPTGEERAVIENPDFEDPGFTTDEIIAWFQAVTAVSVGGATARPVLDTVGNLVHLCQAILEAWELSPIKSRIYLKCMLDMLAIALQKHAYFEFEVGANNDD
ncbi:hypothetical protein PIIN_02441 [Serendipita indica DSM 11827]|uniref:Uncharacterized protein n=1 Tax=Serendipita indica (strain DSM 11827) TaxID=1109443 RepID=G4TB85_SERID|nr:hypothetical protein PIIN_02441 [Serendipita indica DSM 11827]